MRLRKLYHALSKILFHKTKPSLFHSIHSSLSINYNVFRNRFEDFCVLLYKCTVAAAMFTFLTIKIATTTLQRDIVQLVCSRSRTPLHVSSTHHLYHFPSGVRFIFKSLINLNQQLCYFCLNSKVARRIISLDKLHFFTWSCLVYEEFRTHVQTELQVMSIEFHSTY